ncbi:hypothetical protein [Noviherbaspirillum aerium]|uniref:hypothetical protein n=1 Tax=Noviherbaspirillum aerium TaxID=2588497 RepID=UPI00124CD52E|nr:hypothetical protein [Noviherbaspirillum aerium]
MTIHAGNGWRVSAAALLCGMALGAQALAAQASDWNKPALPAPGTSEPAATGSTATVAASASAAKESDETEASNSPHPLRLRLGFDYPLRTSAGGDLGAGTQGPPAVSPTLQAELRYNPASYWFGSITFYRYLMGDRQRPWNPDFTYAFGYDDWHPNTFSLVYGNYSGNRLRPEETETVSRFRQGVWSLGYKFEMPEILDPLFKVADDHQVNCSINANLTQRYTDLATLSLKKNKRTVSLGCRYTLPNSLYANATVFYYPDRTQQQPWDPDFTYGFGYFDWRPGTVTIQYNNYAGNRYPGRDTPGQGGFRRGSVSISWSASW